MFNQLELCLNLPLKINHSHSENCVAQGGFSCKSGHCLSEENICDPSNGCEDKSDQEFQFCSGM